MFEPDLTNQWLTSSAAMTLVRRQAHADQVSLDCGRKKRGRLPSEIELVNALNIGVSVGYDSVATANERSVASARRVRIWHFVC
jgi:hypothetical protein